MAPVFDRLPLVGVSAWPASQVGASQPDITSGTSSLPLVRAGASPVSPFICHVSQSWPPSRVVVWTQQPMTGGPDGLHDWLPSGGMTMTEYLFSGMFGITTSPSASLRHLPPICVTVGLPPVRTTWPLESV